MEFHIPGGLICQSHHIPEFFRVFWHLAFVEIIFDHVHGGHGAEGKSWFSDYSGVKDTGSNGRVYCTAWELAF